MHYFNRSDLEHLAGITCFVVLLIIAGCKHVEQRVSHTATTALFDTQELEIIQSPTDKAMYSVLLPLPSNQTSIYAYAMLYVEADNVITDSIPIITESSGQSNRTKTMRGLIRSQLQLSGKALRIGLQQGQVITYYPATCAGGLAQEKSDSTSPLLLTPFVEASGDSLIRFGISAQRRTVVSGEYLPSSEDLRVEVLHENKVIWKSNKGMAFLTVIQPVRPENIGESSTYALEWDLIDELGSRLQAGTYTARLMIPSRPAPYLIETSFTWPLKRN